MVLIVESSSCAQNKGFQDPQECWLLLRSLLLSPLRHIYQISPDPKIIIIIIIISVQLRPLFPLVSTLFAYDRLSL